MKNIFYLMLGSAVFLHASKPDIKITFLDAPPASSASSSSNDESGEIIEEIIEQFDSAMNGFVTDSALWRKNIATQLGSVVAQVNEIKSSGTATSDQLKLLNERIEALEKRVEALGGLETRVMRFEGNSSSTSFLYKIGTWFLSPATMQWFTRSLLNGVTIFSAMYSMNTFVPEQYRFMKRYPELTLTSWVLLLYLLNESGDLWNMASRTIEPYLPSFITSRQSVTIFRADLALGIIYGLGELWGNMKGTGSFRGFSKGGKAALATNGSS